MELGKKKALTYLSIELGLFLFMVIGHKENTFQFKSNGLFLYEANVKKYKLLKLYWSRNTKF